MFCHAFWPTYGSLLPHVPIFTLEQILYSDIFICSWRGKFQLGCVWWRSLHVCMFQIWFWVSLFLSQFQNHPNPSLQINIFKFTSCLTLRHARVCARIIRISNIKLSIFFYIDYPSSLFCVELKNKDTSSYEKHISQKTNDTFKPNFRGTR